MICKDERVYIIFCCVSVFSNIPLTELKCYAITKTKIYYLAKRHLHN